MPMWHISCTISAAPGQSAAVSLSCRGPVLRITPGHDSVRCVGQVWGAGVGQVWGKAYLDTTASDASRPTSGKTPAGMRVRERLCAWVHG